ncbi:ABC transporter ATP-binding protein [Pollutimonas nitritireducens]|uniref:ABC transporter ATP-binding protein n=1 Tax=Pollutimonas nitritireducens TaxID=2045209 RepID=A0A2N4UKI5_9BURK|nr:ABC transporter ATP-binding protein [Pollutimonas nitritireducens]PLC55544.1 ABC transporter ATP-binding protein [Pollutimonas nitritireducens]
MNTPETTPLLSVRDLHAHYGKSHILQGVSFDVGASEIVSLLGRNGSGRSTTVKAIMGLVQPTGGQVLLDGHNLAGKPSYAISRAGIAYVPEEREVFGNLTVDENLAMGTQHIRSGAATWTVEQMFDYFPRLKERRNTQASNLSGGEQQMLTICRSLLGNPRIIMIDEPTEGLAPKIVTVVGEAIQDIHRRGVAVILVEQKLTIALKISSQVCLLGHGHIVFTGTPHELTGNPKMLKDWLAV